jgi:hypothetical protein
MRAVCGCAAIVFCFASTAVLSFPLVVSTLPKDEYEAMVMVRTGLLDSLDWERLKQFYVQPLNVPSGDLRLLRELNELWDDDLPVSPSQLEKYVPWTESDRQRFFSDYPQLDVYKPVLSFNTSKAVHFSDVSFNVHADETLRPVALSRFTVSPGQLFSVSGSAFHKDSTLQWRTRTMNVVLPGSVRIEAGNFATADDRGLFFGSFPDDREAQTTGSNWLYGNSKTYNGILAITDCWDRSHVTAFFHERSTENIQEIAYTAGVGGSSELMAGVARAACGSRTSQIFSADPALDRTYYLHGGIKTRLAGFDGCVYTGVDASHPLAVPLSAQVSRRSGFGSVKVMAARLPGCLRLPLSSIAYLCRRDYDTTGTFGGFPDMTLLECRTSLYARAGLETSMDLCSVMYGRGADFQATVRAQGVSFVGYRLEYACRTRWERPQTIHNVNCAFERKLGRNGVTTLGLSCRYYCRDNVYQSVFLRVPLDIAVLPAMNVSPFLTFFSNTDRENATGAGLNQTLHLFDKTWCEWSGQVSRDESRVWDWNVDIRTDFLF